MAEDERPQSIRVAVPESYGDAFGKGENRQWLERRVYIGRDVKGEIGDLLEIGIGQQKAFDRLCEIFSNCITGWGLTTEDGEALPDPWQNPAAFDTLADVSLDLFLWCSRVIFTSLGMLVPVEKN